MQTLNNVWMKKLYTTLLIAFCCQAATAQSFSMDDLVNLASANTSQFGNYVAKKGYRHAAEPTAEGLVYAFAGMVCLLAVYHLVFKRLIGLFIGPRAPSRVNA